MGFLLLHRWMLDHGLAVWFEAACLSIHQAPLQLPEHPSTLMLQGFSRLKVLGCKYS